MFFASQTALNRDGTICIFRNGDLLIGPRYMSYRTRYGLAEEDLFLIFQR